MKKYKGELLCFLSAILFGGALLFQQVGGDSVPTFYLVAIRFLLGSLCILPIALKDKTSIKKYLKYGIICGICLFVATTLQQTAIVHTSVGKAGFVASLYIFFIPIERFFILKKKISPKTVFSIIVALTGSFLLYDINGLAISKNDILLVMSSILYALQIVLVERFLKKVKPIKLALVQYLACAILSLIAALFKETLTINMLKDGMISILYLGIVSSGFAYTIQMVGQRYVDSSVAGLILSLESVVSLLIGYIFLNEVLAGKEMIGCMLMLSAVIILEIPDKK